jgi:hypothetical protein
MKYTNLVEFYKVLCENIGLVTNEEGYIYLNSGDDKIMITADGKPLVLPTKQHLDSLLTTDDEGEITVAKIPFNPLNENIVKGDTLSLTRTKKNIEAQLSLSINIVGNLLLTLASNQELQKKTKLEINKFLSRITEAQNAGIKKLVDDKTIENWNKLSQKFLTHSKKMVSIYLKKSGVYNGVKYNRLATLNCNLYEELLKADVHTPVLDVKLRNKDITIFKIIIEFIFNELDKNNVMSIGSNDGESPAFISLMNVFIKVGKRIQKLIKDLSFVDKRLVDQLQINVTLTEKDLESLSAFKGELAIIPNEHDINRTKKAKVEALTMPADVATSDVGHLPIDPVTQQPIAQQPVMPVQQPTQMQNTYTPMPTTPLPYNQQPQQTNQDIDPLDMALARSGTPVVPVMDKNQFANMQMANQNMMMQQPNMMMPQQNMIPNQSMMYQQVQPIGVNQIGQNNGYRF